jgi:hypothetical protein
VRVPEDAADGKAKVTVSFAAWKVRDVKPSTTEVTVGEKPAVEKAGKEDR